MTDETSVCYRTWKTELWLSVRGDVTRAAAVAGPPPARRGRSPGPVGQQVPSPTPTCRRSTATRELDRGLLGLRRGAHRQPRGGRRHRRAGRPTAGTTRGGSRATTGGPGRTPASRPGRLRPRLAGDRGPTGPDAGAGAHPALVRRWTSGRWPRAGSPTGWRRSHTPPRDCDTVANMGGDLRVISPGTPWAVAADPDRPASSRSRSGTRGRRRWPPAARTPFVARRAPHHRPAHRPTGRHRRGLASACWRHRPRAPTRRRRRLWCRRRTGPALDRAMGLDGWFVGEHREGRRTLAAAYRVRRRRARRLRGMVHVLLIEDDPGIRTAVTRALLARGHAVDTAPDGLDGLQMPAHAEPRDGDPRPGAAGYHRRPAAGHDPRRQPGAR